LAWHFASLLEDGFAMIEINLLPGARKPVRTTGPAGGIGAALSGFGSRIKDGFLIFGVVGLVLGAGAVAFMWMRSSSTEAALNERLQRAVQDSTRNAGVVRELRAARARLDSVNTQLGIIRTIDGERYTWAHVLDEISEALPNYRWLTSIAQTTPVIPVPILDSLCRQEASIYTDLSALIASDSTYRLGIRVVGQTIEFQALTQFMRRLSTSPFLGDVTLVNSRLQQAEGYQVTEFTLTMRTIVPDSIHVRRVPLSIAVR
jgi:Tfp pilus assembly protein PilN